MLSSSFVVLHFAFMSMIHFEVTFVNVVWLESRFMLFCMSLFSCVSCICHRTRFFTESPSPLHQRLTVCSCVSVSGVCLLHVIYPCVWFFTQSKLPWLHRLYYISWIYYVSVLGRETWCAAIHGVAKHRTRPSDWTEANWTDIHTWITVPWSMSALQLCSSSVSYWPLWVFFLSM